MKRRLAGSVVVVTGATSGAGRATALAFADHRAALVLAARRADELEDVAKECRARGARAIAVATDVGDPVAVERLRRDAVAEFGTIDTWVEMAAVLLAGHLPDTPVEEVAATLRTNAIGTALTARAALAQFGQQGHGVLIITSSVLAIVPNPIVPVYTMTKFAVHGLALALQSSLGRRGPIRVCEVLPGPLDTPMFVRAGNHTGHMLRAIPPACAPERAAAAVLRCARRPRRRAVVGLTGRLVVFGMRVSPSLTRWAVAAYSGRLILTHRPTADTPGAVLAPPPGGRAAFEWRRSALRRALGARLGRAMAGRPSGG